MATAVIPYVDQPAGIPMHHSAPRSGVLEFLKTYRRHIWLFVLVSGLVMAAAAGYTFTQVPRYTATAQLVIAPRPAEIGAQRTSALSDPAADSSVDTQVELLKSRTLAAVVANRLDLANPARFALLTRQPTLGDRIPGADRIRGMATKQEALPAIEARREEAAERLQQGLQVNRNAQTFALNVSFTHADPKLAASIVNAFASQFVSDSVAVKRADSDGVEQLLRSQLAGARTEVENADAELGRYKVAHNLMSVQGGTIAEQQLSSLDQQVALARAGEAEATARLQTARGQLAGGSSGDDLGEALGSPVIQQLRSQRAETSGTLADLGSRYGARHPRRVAAERQLADIDTQIQGEINRTVSNLEAQRDVAARRTASLTGSASGARAAVAGNNLASIPLAGLQLRADTARTNYGQLLGRVNEINAQSATARPDARIVSLSPIPLQPSSPNTSINLLVGGLLAIGAGLGAVFLRQGTDEKLRTLEDVEARLQMPYLAGLPTLASAVRHPSDTDPISALLDHRESAYAESFRGLAASILEASNGKEVRTIALTSALPNEGKTTASIGLARTLGLSGKRVVLVDADMRRPSVGQALGMQPVVGLQQVLEGTATLADALVLDVESGAFILPMLRSGKMASGSFTNGSFDSLIEELKEQFEIVLFDASPVLPVVDGRLIAKKADATVLLARWSQTPDAAVEMAAHMLRALGVNMTGVALTRVDLHELARTGYGDPARFLGSYQSYYA